MTLDSLQSRRKSRPFLIAIACILPILVHSGGLEPIQLRYMVIAISVGLIVPFFYVVMKLREPRWNREQEEYVRSRIRRSLIKLMPIDLEVTREEEEQLESAEIYKTLTGVFWETVNQDEELRAQKEQFYSNGLDYSTALDVFLLLRFFGIIYLCTSLLLGDYVLFFAGTALVVVALASRWIAVPIARRRHLELSAEQLELLKRRKGQYVSERFREIVLEWRREGRPVLPEPKHPLRPRHLILADAFAVAFVLAIAVCGVVMRGWFGAEARIKSDPKEASSYVGDGKHDKPVVVVFVHGVFGDRNASWLNVGSTSGFPQLIASDPVLSHDVDVFVFEYFTPKFSLAPSIVDLADQLRGALDDQGVFTRHKKVVFLAHSMGGIVVRQYLVGNPDKMALVPMIYFYATPTNGSELAALAKIASRNPQLRGMTPLESNDFLQSITSNWLNSSKAQSIASYCGIEELPTDGATVVARASATALCNRPLDPFSANHIDIVKPENRSDPRYTRFRSALEKEVPSLAAPPGE